MSDRLCPLCSGTEGQLAAVVGALRKGRQEMEWRLQDLLTCNKPDDCHTRALGADVAIADFDVATKALLSDLSAAAQQHDADVARAAVELYIDTRDNPPVHPFTCECGWSSGPIRMREQGKGAAAYNAHRLSAHPAALLTPTEVET